jgi:hypothetical protein
MSPLEFVVLVIAFPFAVALGAWLGRNAMRYLWELDKPYDERLRGIKRKAV